MVQIAIYDREKQDADKTCLWRKSDDEIGSSLFVFVVLTSITIQTMTIVW
jgi:hypothetical protein